MATSLPLPATQVGTYFVGQYYQMMQNQPDHVHQFYSDASTMLRIDGHSSQTASAMLQIHQLVMSLNYMDLEIKTTHSLDSWNGGVLVMVTGSVLIKDFNGRKNFAETFFLAPQEKGYFVLSDIFHYVNEEQNLQPSIITYLPHSNLDSSFNSSIAVQEQVPSYFLGGDIQSREYTFPMKINENSPVNNYIYPKEQLAHISSEKIIDDNFAVRSNGSIQGHVNSIHGHLSPSPIEEPVQKHTYASILQVAKAQPSPAVSTQSSIKKTAPSDWQQMPEIPNAEYVGSNNTSERSSLETIEEASWAIDDEVKAKSVYVKNVPTNMTASAIAEEFKKFGKIRPDGVAIRSRKDTDGCYAFVEYEDMSSVHNAVEASMVQIGRHQLRVEGRRPNRGRGRGNYGGRTGSGRSGQDGADRDYNSRSRGNNGYYKQVSAKGSRKGAS